MSLYTSMIQHMTRLLLFRLGNEVTR